MHDVDFTSLRILVAEDEAFIRDMLVRFLRRFGTREIYEARDGTDALAKVKLVRPDVVLCDIEMEPVGGFEFLQAIRTLPPPQRATPVIFLTGHADDAAVHRAMDLKVNDYLLKPVSANALKERIGQLLRARQPAP